MTWSGILVDRPARATLSDSVTNGPAGVQIYGQAPPPFSKETSDVGRVYPLPFESPSTGSALTISYTRQFEVNPCSPDWSGRYEHGSDLGLQDPADIAASPQDIRERLG